MAKIYHYTSIKTLALILENKKIRFNRLDYVDDVEESCYSSGSFNTQLGHYVFVSCWTRNSEENLALWNMYTNYKGVRIGIDEDLFITTEQGLRKDFFTLPKDIKDCESIIGQNKIELYPIQYVKNPEDEIKSAISSININDNESGIHILLNKIGVFKRIHWSIQQESRFKIVVAPSTDEKIKIPLNQNLLYSLFETIITSQRKFLVDMLNNKPIKTTFIDIPFNAEKLNSLEIVIGPQSTEGEKLIVKKLLQDYPEATISSSIFSGKIRKKN